MIHMIRVPQDKLYARQKPERLRLIGELLDELSAREIGYCHWKSNNQLSAALQGVGDLDLLIRPEHCSRFQALITSLGFVGIQPHWNDQPSVFHYYGMDTETGRLVHLHVYYDLVSGGSLLKGHTLPFGELLLSEQRTLQEVKVPTAAAELLVLLARKLLECSSWMERWLLSRDISHLRAEVEWLLSNDGLDYEELEKEVLLLAKRYTPWISAQVLRTGLRRLSYGDPLQRLAKPGRQFKGFLSSYAHHGYLQASFLRAARLGRRFLSRIGGSMKRRPAVRGSVTAITGTDGAGKSSSLQALHTELSKNWDVRRFHLGKPPLCGLASLIRDRTPKISSRKEIAAKRHQDVARKTTLISACKAALLATLRKQHAAQAHRQARRGSVVICDRYPSNASQIDGPRLSSWLDSPRGWQRYLAEWELRCYQAVPPADVEIRLTVSRDEVLHRNRLREEHEPEPYILRRWEQFARHQVQTQKTVIIDADQPQEVVQTEVRVAVWAAIAGRELNHDRAGTSPNESTEFTLAKNNVA